MDFTHNGWRYNLVYIQGTARIRVFYQTENSSEWVFGHGKTIPEGMKILEAEVIMKRYLTEQIGWEEYNQLLPGV